MTNRSRLILICVAILLIFGLFGLAVAGKAMPNFISNNLSGKQPIDPYKAQIEELQKELQNEKLSGDARDQAQAKLDTIANMATQWAEGKLQQTTRAVEKVASPPSVIPGMKLPDGIDENPSVPFSENIVSVLNSWRKTTDEKYYLIYSGYLTENPTQGVLLVYHPETHDFVQHSAPQGSGGVRVILEDGTFITLRSISGELFYFEASIEQFTNSEGSPLTTPTLPAFATPTVVEDTSSTPTPPAPYP